MEVWQRERIRMNYDYIVKFLDHVDDVLDRMLTQEVLPVEATVNTIRRETNPKQKIRNLLTHLQKRPPDDFKRFVWILYETGNEHIAKRLDPDEERPSQASSPRQAKPLSQGLPLHQVPAPPKPHAALAPRVRDGGDDGPRLPTGVQVDDNDESVLAKAETFLPGSFGPGGDRDAAASSYDDWREIASRTGSVKPVTDETMEAKFKRLERLGAGDRLCYDMTKRVRAIVWYNDPQPTDPQHRPCDNSDLQSLNQLFEQMEFETETWRNLSREELLNKLRKENQPTDEYSCLVMVINTPGRNEKELRTADNQVVTLDEVLGFFENGRSPRFKGKPKIFFVQHTDGAVSIPDGESEVPDDMVDQLSQISLGDDSRYDDSRYDDMIVVTSGRPGCIMQSVDGVPGRTCLILALVEILRNFACSHDLLELIAKMKELGPGARFPVCNILFCRLQPMKVYFFPGLPSGGQH